MRTNERILYFHSLLIILVLFAGLLGPAFYRVAAKRSPNPQQGMNVVEVKQRFAAIDHYISEQMKVNHIPGVALAITQDDQIIYQNGYGIADPSGQAMTPQTPMLIGSVSKSFTALAIMQLYEAGKVDLQAPVKRYLPWFSMLPPVSKKADTNASRSYDAGDITISHLLNHTSGISRASGEHLLSDGDLSSSALEHHVRMLCNQHLNRPVGEGFEYSNANYDVLGLVVQEVSGQLYEDYIQRHIFDPLEMEHSFTSQTEAQEHGMAVGFRQWFGFPVPARNLPFVRGDLPAGYLISSADDLGHYLIAQVNQGRYQNNSILSPQLNNAMHLPVVEAQPEGYHRKPSGSYANGWYRMEINGIPVMAHDGDTPNFHADVIILPEENMGIVVLINTNTVLLGDDIRNLATSIISLLSNRPLTSNKVNVPVLWFYAGMLVVLVFEISRLIRLIQEGWVSYHVSVPGQTIRFPFRQFILPVMIGFLVAGWMFVGIPWLFRVSFPVMMLNQPDLTTVIAIAGGLAIVNGVLRSGLNLRKVGIILTH